LPGPLPLPAPDYGGDADWVARLSRRFGVALSVRDGVLAVGGSDALWVYRIPSGEMVLSR
jgi:hypothetical protein